MTTHSSHTVWRLPCKSQECNEGPRLETSFDTAKLLFDYETDSGEYAWDSIELAGVRGLSFTAAQSCLPEQIDAYDKLVEINPSEWIDSLQNRSPGGYAPKLYHYRIFFDEVGCYEFAAE